MPQVIITEGSIRGLECCRKFLSDKSPLASKRASQAISNSFALLENYPDIGRPYKAHPELRELVIEFGTSGYIALYRYNPLENAVHILAFRDQKEFNYL